MATVSYMWSYIKLGELRWFAYYRPTRRTVPRSYPRDQRITIQRLDIDYLLYDGNTG